MRFNKGFTIILFAFLTVGFLPRVVFAQASNGEFSVSPVNERLNMAPGEAYTSKVTITNNSNRSLEFGLSEIQFKMNPQGKIGISDEPKLGWFEYPSKRVTVKAGKSYIVNLKIKIPDNVVTGPYFPALLIDADAAEPNKNQTGTGVGASIAYVVGINVLGGYPTASIKITDLTVTNPVMDSKATITYAMANTLNAFTKPSARLQVINWQGQKVYEQVINPELNTLAPGQVLSGKIDLSAEQLSQLGQYKVELLALDEQFDTASFAKAEFWVLEIGVVIVAVVISLSVLGAILVIGLLLYRRSDKRTPPVANSFK